MVQFIMSGAEPSVEYKTSELDERLKSPFSPEQLVIEREVPQIAGITDTHYQTNLWQSLKEKAFSNGKADLLGAAGLPVVGKYFRNQYRALAQMNQIALHTARQQLEKALNNADLLIHGGDVTDSLTLFGILGDLSFHENYLRRRLERSGVKGERDGFLGTVVMNGNHDTEYNTFDRVLRYDTLAFRVPHISLDTYKGMLQHIESGGSMSELFAKLGDTPEGFDRQIIAPGLRWYLLRKYYGQAIGAIVDTEKKQQVFFFDSEVMDSTGSPEALRKSLVKDVALDQKDPDLLEQIVGLRAREAAMQQELISRMFTTCEYMTTVVYAHDPIKMQQQFIDYYQQVVGESRAWAQQFVEENITIWGGHWHVNDDGTAEEWNKPGVRWWNGSSRIDKPWSAYSPRRQKRDDALDVEFLAGDYVSVLTGNAIEPTTERVSGGDINAERTRLYAVARILKTVPNLYKWVQSRLEALTTKEGKEDGA